MYRTIFALSLAALPLLSACTDSSIDDFAADDVTDSSLDDGKADRTVSPSYFLLTPDFRRCASPVCGGVYYSLANGNSTTCLDGKRADRCYAASVDWTRLGLDEGGLDQARTSLGARDLIVRATVGTRTYPNGLGRFAELRPTEAYDGQGGNAPEGIFTKVELSGVRCITTPCPLFKEQKLNATTRANLAEIDFAASGADEETIGRGQDALTGGGLIIVGDRYQVTGPGGRMAARTAVNFYTRVTDAGVEQPAGHVETRDFSAWESRLPGAPVSFHVVGTVDLPSPGYTATLVPAAPQGINPNDLILELRLAPRDGFFPQVITPTEVRYDVTPYADTYRTVLVRQADGSGLPLTVTTAF